MTQPTEPIPFVPPPPNSPRSRKSWLRRHATSIAAIAVAIAVAAAAVWFGAMEGASSDSTWTAESAAPAVTVSTTPAPVATPTVGSASAGARTIVRAVILNQSGSAWTVRDRSDALTLITITPRTRFGAEGSRAASNRFRPGEDVVILGTAGKGSVTADWVIAERLLLERGEKVAREAVRVEVPVWDPSRSTFLLGLTTAEKVKGPGGKVKIVTKV